MSAIETALEFAKGGAGFGLGAPSLPLAAIAFFWTGWIQRSPLFRLWKPHHWLVFTHLLFFGAAIVVGVIFAAPLTLPASLRQPNRTANLLLNLITVASFGSCGFWIWRMKGFRWFAASLMWMMEILVFGALFVAGMSVTADWI